MNSTIQIVNILHSIHSSLLSFSESDILENPDILDLTQDFSLSSLLEQENFHLFNEETEEKLKDFNDKFEAFSAASKSIYRETQYPVKLATLKEWKLLKMAALEAEKALKNYLLSMGIIPGAIFNWQGEDLKQVYEMFHKK